MKTYPKLIITVAVFFALCCCLQAQSFPDFKPLHYDEDFQFLRKDSSNNNWYKNLKHTALSKNENTYISFGGDVRWQYFFVKHEHWGDVPNDRNGYFLGRYLFHADLHSGKHFRTFVQLQSSTAFSKIKTSVVDQNPLDWHQAFADINFNPNAKTTLILRAGRQELSYGSQRIISVRDGPNNRNHLMQ